MLYFDILRLFAESMHNRVQTTHIYSKIFDLWVSILYEIKFECYRQL